MEAVIIDPLFGNEYSINLFRELQKVVHDLILILPAKRKVKSLLNLKLKFGEPSKDRNENKVKKAVNYTIYLIRLNFIINYNKNCIIHSSLIHCTYSFGRTVIAINVADFFEINEDNKNGKILKKISLPTLAKTILKMFSENDF